jgi:hypothetical protein
VHTRVIWHRANVFLVGFRFKRKVHRLELVAEIKERRRENG